jgi:hypothetical protein
MKQAVRDQSLAACVVCMGCSHMLHRASDTISSPPFCHRALVPGGREGQWTIPLDQAGQLGMFLHHLPYDAQHELRLKQGRWWLEQVGHLHKGTHRSFVTGEQCSKAI